MNLHRDDQDTKKRLIPYSQAKIIFDFKLKSYRGAHQGVFWSRFPVKDFAIFRNPVKIFQNSRSHFFSLSDFVILLITHWSKYASLFWNMKHCTAPTYVLKSHTYIVILHISENCATESVSNENIYQTHSKYKLRSNFSTEKNGFKRYTLNHLKHTSSGRISTTEIRCLVRIFQVYDYKLDT